MRYAEDDEIVITKPGTAFLLGYIKSAEEPRLVLTRSRVAPAASKSELSRSSVSGGGQQGAQVRLDRISFTQRKQCHAHVIRAECGERCGQKAGGTLASSSVHRNKS